MREGEEREGGMEGEEEGEEGEEREGGRERRRERRERGRGKLLIVCFSLYAQPCIFYG